MAPENLDTDGFTETIRRRIVQTALARLRLRQIEPATDLLALYEQYCCGKLSRTSLGQHMNERLAALLALMQPE